MKVRTADGLIATLDDTHWVAHITARHPELRDHREQVIETLEYPEGVFRSKRDRGTRIYFKVFGNVVISGTEFVRMPLLVHVREHSGFVVTAYFAASMWRNFGEKIWPL